VNRKEPDVVEFVGMIGTRHVSEIRPSAGPVIDPRFLTRFAQAHENGGFDRVLIGYGSGDPESTQVAAHVAARTERLGLLIAHRPGFVFPTLAARTFATLDHLSGGRVAVHVITGGNDADQRREGDYLGRTSATRGPTSTCRYCGGRGRRARSTTRAATTG
jgi:alkanesulfonate monooxygenase